jgi:hypothetical protein
MVNFNTLIQYVKIHILKILKFGKMCRIIVKKQNEVVIMFRPNYKARCQASTLWNTLRQWPDASEYWPTFETFQRDPTNERLTIFQDHFAHPVLGREPRQQLATVTRLIDQLPRNREANERLWQQLATAITQIENWIDGVIHERENEERMRQDGLHYRQMAN